MTNTKNGKAVADISDYDQENYDYRNYWHNRRYEDKAEKMLLNRLLKNSKGNRFIDIGGSFGRNLIVVSKKYKEVVILDYSLQTLLKYEKEILERFPNAKLVAGNAYKLPFAKNSFDGGMSIRVLHHLNKPEVYFKEVARILGSGAIYIQEVANKIHLKARLKWFFQGKLEMFDEAPYQQPSQGNKEGSSTEGIFLNYHPSHIKKEMLREGFLRLRNYGCSFFRIPTIKRILPITLLLRLEKFAQILFGRANLTPSVLIRGYIFKNSTPNDSKKNSQNTEKSFNEILRCPTCQGRLEISHKKADCKKCSLSFEKHSTVWDLRV